MLKAIHAIQTRDANGRIIRIAPGQVFDAGEHEEALIKRGAASKTQDEPAAVPQASSPEPEKTAKEAVEEAQDLDDMTKAELVAYADSHHIEIDEKANKADVRAAIDAALADEDLV